MPTQDPGPATTTKLTRVPATEPTSLPPANAPTDPLVAAPMTEHPSSRAQRATVIYNGGQLNVRANNSSLNQILRSISQQTGLKITGGVQDQRVFGNYGPGSTSSVLATLLDGTGTNLLLLEGNTTTPPELILTARGGGPTPPNPNAPGFDDGADETQPTPPQDFQRPQQTLAPGSAGNGELPQSGAGGPRPIAQPLNNVLGNSANTTPTASDIPTAQSIPIDSVSTPSTAVASPGIVDSTNPPPAGSTTGTTPNGPAPTPEQIYQQLLKLQQQQANQAPANNTPQ